QGGVGGFGGSAIGGTGQGGAIFSSAGSVQLSHSTVAGNHALGVHDGFTGPHGHGGGVFNDNTTANAVTLTHTTLAGNDPSSGEADGIGTLTSQDYNLIQNTTGITFAGITTHNITGKDPLL